jgi:hypothetical protein
MLDFMERNAMNTAPDPPHSPDLASSDFSLFGHGKQLSRGHEVPDREALLHASMIF